MTDCNCLSQKIEFNLYHDRKLKWHECVMMMADPRRIKGTTITIHGDTVDEIDKKAKELIEEYKKGYTNVICTSYSV